MDKVRISIFATELGWIAAAAHEDSLQELTFGHRSADEAARSLRHVTGKTSSPDAFLRDVVRRLKSFARQPADDFRDIRLGLAELTEFQQAVIRNCRRIPIGGVLTYGELARKAGRPGAARAVGQVMAANRFPLIVPCHRVIGANGTLGGYSARDGLEMKLRLLALEGAVCLDDCDCHG